MLFSLGLCVCIQFVIIYIGTRTYKYYWRNMDGQVYKHAFIDKDMNFHTFSV
jgi:hypothetical protein